MAVTVGRVDGRTMADHTFARLRREGSPGERMSWKTKSLIETLDPTLCLTNWSRRHKKRRVHRWHKVSCASQGVAESFEHGSNATQGPFPWPGAQVFQTMLFFELSSSMIHDCILHTAIKASSKTNCQCGVPILLDEKPDRIRFLLNSNHGGIFELHTPLHNKPTWNDVFSTPAGNSKSRIFLLPFATSRMEDSHWVRMLLCFVTLGRSLCRCNVQFFRVRWCASLQKRIHHENNPESAATKPANYK